MENFNSFAVRHIGLSQADIESLLDQLGYKDLEEFSKSVLPENIFIDQKLELNDAMSEEDALKAIKEISKANSVYRSFIGQGYYGTITPKVILRNVFENPGWYTSYTPYQAEISQGRLEALINFQTMVGDLTGFEIANASLLDEATAAAESMTLAHRVGKSKSQKFFIDQNCFPQTISVVSARAKPIGIEIVVDDPKKLNDLTEDMYFGALLQYPGNDGAIVDFSQEIKSVHENNGLVIMATDLLALALLKSPSEIGADIAIGSSQRFGVPLGFGGPHAAFMATREQYKRSLPGRLIGASIDADGRTAYRLALQTREQHIRREKATSNICTAQALLAIIAAAYAIYHGPERLKNIASNINYNARYLKKSLQEVGLKIISNKFFDTLVIEDSNAEIWFNKSVKEGINFRLIDSSKFSLTIDETTTLEDIDNLILFFNSSNKEINIEKIEKDLGTIFSDESLIREDEILTHPIFNIYHSETEMMRYL